MRYWVYINGKVIEMPFEEGELSAIKGFNADTLVCKETPAPGETQEWVPAKMLIDSYKQPVPPPPPSKQVIEKFSHKPQDTFIKEPKATILSSNIFGSEGNKNQTPENVEAVLDRTEALSPEEMAQEGNSLTETQRFKEEIFSEPPTEVVSFDEMKGIDLDKYENTSTESEEEILKTAIRTTISNKNVKKEEKTVQAVDIVNNNSIDLSDNKEETSEEDKREETTSEQNLSETELTPLGDSEKKPLTRLFDSEPIQEETQPSSQEEESLSSSEKEETHPSAEQHNDVEDEFSPEEEISLEDDDFIIDNNEEENPVIENNEPASKEVQKVLQELASDKLEIQEQKEGQNFEETFKTQPALVAELQEENPVKEEEPVQENDILDSQDGNENKGSIEDHPTTLEELTGRYPIEEEAPAKEEAEPTPQENPSEGVVVPAEIHPDVIVEEVKEETVKDRPAESQANPETQTVPDKDNFLNTFSSDIETVFLDQPTAFISDYIPPAETKEEDNLQVMQSNQKEDAKPEILDIKSDQGQHQVSLQNVRRVKPAAIKTVPMVEGEHQDPFSRTQIQNLHDAEEARNKIEKNNNIINLVKAFGLITVLLLMLMAFVALVAQVNIIPRDFSPIHVLWDKMFTRKTKKDVQEKTLTPNEIALRDLKEAETLRINKLIQEVKDYQLAEGLTVDEKIKKLHPNVYDQLKWEGEQYKNDPTFYLIKVSSPTNPEGYAQVNYRFNYNTVYYTVEATTSEANNLMVVPYQEPQQNKQQAQQK